MELKICKKCKDNKPLSEYHKKRGTKDGHRNECKECIKKYQRVYRNNQEYKLKEAEYDKNRYYKNRIEILKHKQEYHIQNREEILEKKRIYQLNNKEKIKKWRDENKDIINQGQKRYRDNNHHIIAWRSILYRTLKYFGTIKEGHTIDILGYSAEDLKCHIEKQFIDGMNWENYGRWEIDHIRPLCTFPHDTDPAIVNALSNLRPLWKKDNLERRKFFY